MNDENNVQFGGHNHLNSEYNVVNYFEQSYKAFEPTYSEYNEPIVQIGGINTELPSEELDNKLTKLECFDRIAKLSKNIKYLGIDEDHLKNAYEINNCDNTVNRFKDTLIMIILENNLNFFKYDDTPSEYHNDDNNFIKYLVLVFAIDFYFQIFLNKYIEDDHTISFHEKAMEQAILMFSFLDEYIFKVNDKKSNISYIFKNFKFSKQSENDNFKQLVCYYCIILLQQINIDCLLILPENNTKLLKKIKEIAKNYDNIFNNENLNGDITKKLNILYSNIYNKDTKDRIFTTFKYDYNKIINYDYKKNI